MAEIFQPLHLADALEVLRAELEDELKGANAEHALLLLRLELEFAIDQGRAWAAERGLRFNFPKPNPDSSAEACMTLLRCLAEVLRELASREGMRVSNDNAWPEEED